MTALNENMTYSHPPAADPGNAPRRVTPSQAGRRPMSSLRRMSRMMRFESSMVIRQRNTMLATLLAPLFILAFPILTRPDTHEAWVRLVAPMTVLVLVFSVYITAATVLAARRENQILKRMRTSEVTSVELVASMTVPLIVLGIVQVLIVHAGVWVLGGPMTENLGMFVLATIGSAVLSVTAGVAIGAMSPNSERVQYTAMPLLLLAAIGSNLVVAPASDAVRSYLLLAPFTGMVDLVARAGGLPAEALATPPLPLSAVGMNIATTAFWVIVMVFLAFVYWRWEPRR